MIPPHHKFKKYAYLMYLHETLLLEFNEMKNNRLYII